MDTYDLTEQYERGRFRLPPGDQRTITDILIRASFSTKSEVVRAAIETAYLAGRNCGGNRPVVRNEELEEQEDVYVGPGAVGQPERALPHHASTTSTILEVRLFTDDLARIAWLIDSRFGTNRTHVVRRSLSLYLHVLDRCLEGWRFGCLSQEGIFYPIPLPGINRGVDYPHMVLSSVLGQREESREPDSGNLALPVPKLLMRELQSAAAREQCSVELLGTDMLRHELHYREERMRDHRVFLATGPRSGNQALSFLVDFQARFRFATIVVAVREPLDTMQLFVPLVLNHINQGTLLYYVHPDVAVIKRIIEAVTACEWPGANGRKANDLIVPVIAPPKLFDDEPQFVLFDHETEDSCGYHWFGGGDRKTMGATRTFADQGNSQPPQWPLG